MRRLCGLLVGSLLLLSSEAGAEEVTTWTMERAVERALEHNLSLRASAREVDLARAGLVGAEVLTTSNPELAGGAGLRLSGGEALVDAGVALEQRFALGGPRRHRVAGARAAVEVARGRYASRRAKVAAAARIAFVEAVAAGRMVALAQRAEALTEELHGMARARVEEEAGTDLEVNLAALEWARARRQLSSARQAALEARLRLSQLLALPLGRALSLPERLPAVEEVTPSEEAMVASALEQRPELFAVGQSRRQALAEVDWARAEAWPELAVEASYDLEEGQDHIVGLGLTIPIPIFHRNQGQIAEARARASLAELDEEAARRAVEQEVRAAHQRYLAARQVAELLDQETISRADANLALLRASFEEGNVGFVEVLLVQQELLAAQQEAITAMTALFRARVELELAVGNEVQ